MKLRVSLFLIAIISFAFTLNSCSGSKDVVSEESAVSTRSTKEKGRKGMRRSAEEMLANMDTDKDGMLSKTEVKGPLSDQFNTIDTNNDGKISLEELKNAPKRQKGRRGRN